MPTIHTIGHNSKTLERFIHLLQNAEIDAIVDIRLRNTSQLSGFAKRDDLAFLLRAGFKIGYEHRLDLAPSPELLDAFKTGGDWPAYERAYRQILVERDAAAIGREILARYQRPCLLCAEDHPDRCHRRLAAEWWAQHLPGLEIIHLR
jgi:uncharacterized protein (DUF488 family)